jgi:hypothetical protein
LLPEYLNKYAAISEPLERPFLRVSVISDSHDQEDSARR